MRTTDGMQLAFSAVRSQPLRSVLTALGIAVGIAAVVLLTSLGTGLQRYVLKEFTQFGTNLLAVTPGRKTTFGMSGSMINSVRPLSIEDAQALASLPHVLAVSPTVFGNVPVEAGGKSRRCMATATGSAMPEVWRFAVAQGRFLPPDDPRSARAFAVLGHKVWRELFGDRNPLGEIVRIGGDRYRVLGVMEPKGQFLGFDLDDSVYVPVGRGLEMFDREGLMEIDVLFTSESVTDQVAAAVRRTLIARHGVEDCTVTAQQQMLDVLGSVLGVLTFAVAALGGISLVVGGVGILTIMSIALQERIAEIGLLRAIGATRTQLRWLFLGEAAALAAVGGTAGLVVGAGAAWLLGAFVPALPVAITPWQIVLAEAVSLAIGLIAGVLPALRAARLDPIEALRTE
ncbi:MAG TPA: ABC transporter permease [Planctomycetota bacterium]|nr:ABC transporter permease [Planctomycetota bacterium]